MASKHRLKQAMDSNESVSAKETPTLKPVLKTLLLKMLPVTPNRAQAARTVDAGSNDKSSVYYSHSDKKLRRFES